MAYGTRVAFEPIRELAAASVAAGYTAVGTALIDYARVVRFVNTTDVEVYFSIDGTNNHIRLPSNSFFLCDFTSDRVDDVGLFVHVGTIFYVKRVSGAAATGSVWVEVVYAQGGI